MTAYRATQRGGLHTQTIHNILLGRNWPDLHTLARLGRPPEHQDNRLRRATGSPSQREASPLSCAGFSVIGATVHDGPSTSAVDMAPPETSLWRQG